MSMDVFDGSDGDSSAAVHDTYVVNIKGQSFAIGLFWNNFENRQTAVKEARDMAAKPGVDGDLFCVRSSGSQYGIGRKEHGHANNMVALAGALADQRGGSWLGLFQVDSGYYLIAVREDEVLAETDRFILDELDARGRFDELHLTSEWGTVFAPDGFEVDNASTVALEDLIGRAKAPRLQATDKVGGLLRIGIGGAIIAALVIGGMFWYQSMSEEALRAQMAELEKTFQDTVAPQQEEIVVPPAPWEGRPVGVAYLKTCIPAMNRATLSIPGWNTSELLCDGNQVRMTLDRDGELGASGGPISWVRRGLDMVGLKEAQASPTGPNQVQVTWDFLPEQTYPAAVEVAKLATARRYLQTTLEDTFTPVVFDNPQTDEFFSSVPFSFTTPFDPNEFDSILEAVPGLTIDRVFLDLKTFEYRVDGAVHEQIYFPETQNAQLN